MNKYNCDCIYDWWLREIEQKKMVEKNLRKENLTNALNVLYAKKGKKYMLLVFQNITQIVKNKLFY